MGEEAAVLFANEAFYLAFSTRDIRTMSELWSSRLPVSCILPGWRPLRGRDEVLESWVGIFGNRATPAVEMRQPTVFLYGDLAQVLCYEVLEDSVLSASNLFAREQDGWKLVHHHSSPAADPPSFESERPARRRLQ